MAGACRYQLAHNLLWLLQGTLPSSWSSLRSLSWLQLNSGFLEGTLPAAWSRLANLTTLQLQTNRLNGERPARLLVQRLVPTLPSPLKHDSVRCGLL
jgi:hypothetical protein